jgi:hypothetical protein
MSHGTKTKVASDGMLAELNQLVPAFSRVFSKNQTSVSSPEPAAGKRWSRKSFRPVFLHRQTLASL